MLHFTSDALAVTFFVVIQKAKNIEHNNATSTQMYNDMI